MFNPIQGLVTIAQSIFGGIKPPAENGIKDDLVKHVQEQLIQQGWSPDEAKNYAEGVRKELDRGGPPALQTNIQNVLKDLQRVGGPDLVASSMDVVRGACQRTGAGLDLVNPDTLETPAPDDLGGYPLGLDGEPDTGPGSNEPTLARSPDEPLSTRYLAG